MKIRMISDVLKEQYGEKIYRLALSSGCTCPNRDGTVGTGGCTFCSEGGSGEFASAPASVAEQIEKAKALVRGKTAGQHFIAYFQSFTNTYGDMDRLRRLYEEHRSIANSILLIAPASSIIHRGELERVHHLISDLRAKPEADAEDIAGIQLIKL